MDALIAGALIWIIAKMVSGDARRRYGCVFCADQQVRWDGDHFIHGSGHRMAQGTFGLHSPLPPEYREHT